MEWIRSSFCADRQCVEAAAAGDRVLVRDSKRPDRALEFPRGEWDAFLDAVRRGELNDL